MSADNDCVIVVQPSLDYAERIVATGERAVFVVDSSRSTTFGDFANTIKVDTFALTPVLDALQTYSRMHRIRYVGLTCFICEQLPFAAELSNAMGLHFPAPAVVQQSRRKDLAYTLWTHSAVPCPPSQLVRELSDIASFATAHRGPWIFKPADGTGSAWITRVDTADKLELTYRRLQAGANSVPGSAPISFLIQSLASGRELSADFFVDGETFQLLRVTAKLMSDRMGEVVAYYPAVVDASERRAITSVLKSAAASLGLERGLANADLMLTATGPLLLEMALRPGGDCLPDLCQAAHGYNPLREACRVARGLTPHSARPWVETIGYAAVHLLSERSGVVQHVSFAQLAADPTVISYEPYIDAGANLDAASGHYEDRIIGACLVRVESLEQLQRRVGRLVEQVEIVMCEDAPAAVAMAIA